MGQSDSGGANFGAFKILGEIPDGGPGSETAPALRSAIPVESIPEVLKAAREAILTATGPRDGTSSRLNVSQFDHAIRTFMPVGHYERAPNQPISVMDYKMYACRLVHRLLNQVTQEKITVGGGYNSHVATNARANALYQCLLDVAARHQIPAFVEVGWPARLERARLSGSPRAKASNPRSALPGIEAGRPPPPAWASLLVEEGPRRVFLHLAEHGSATEEEIVLFLGSPREFRQFSVKFEEYAQQVPFKVRIESGADGKRYVKEDTSWV